MVLVYNSGQEDTSYQGNQNTCIALKTLRMMAGFCFQCFNLLATYFQYILNTKV